jgi:hypothetical protein
MASNTHILKAISRLLPFTGRLSQIRYATLKADAMGHLFIFAVIISLIGFMEAISVARVATKKIAHLGPRQKMGNLFLREP